MEILNKGRKEDGIAQVKQEDFELLMDRFEKEAFFQSQTSGKDLGPSIDEDAVCNICQDGECQNSNVIYSVTCVTWQCIRNAMVCPTFRKDSGCVGGVYSHPPELWTAVCVQTKEGHSNRQTMAAGHMSSVPCGFQKWGLQILCF